MKQIAGLALAALLALAGCGKGSPSTPAATPAPGATSGPSVPAPVFPGEWRASLDAATIPELPASGQVRGAPFSLESAVLKNGILHLKQGKEFFADKEFVVFLFQKEPGGIPQNKTWNVKADNGFDRPHIHVGYRKAGESMPDHDMFMTGYSMKLELGKESGKKIPGKIWLCVQAEKKEGESESVERRSWVAGTFTATLKGFILRNGEADRAEDALELLPWLAEERLRKENAGKKVKVTNSTCGFMSTNKGTGSGAMDVEWTSDGAKKGWLKFRFEKKNGEWIVSKVWPGDQIPEAHPETPPTGPDAVRTEAAAMLEKLYPGKVVHLSNLFPQLKDGIGAACQAQWQVEGEESYVQKTLYFNWAEGQWRFARMLDEDESFNSRTGAIEKR